VKAPLEEPWVGRPGGGLVYGTFPVRVKTAGKVFAALLCISIFLALALVPAKSAAAGYKLSPELSEKLLNLINEECTSAGLPALTLREDLSKVAEEHAVDMIEGRYFGHTSPTKSTLASRLKSAGIRFSKAAENLAGCTGPELAHKLLMESPSHRANILSKRFTHVGVAVVKGGPYGMMIVEVFIAGPEPEPGAKAGPETEGSTGPEPETTTELEATAELPLDVVRDDLPDVGSLKSPPPGSDSG